MAYEFARADVQRAFDHLASLFDFSQLSSPQAVIAAVRAGLERYGDVTPRPINTDVVIKPITIGAISAEWIYAPDADTSRRILHIHGGGIISGTLTSHRVIVTELARRTGYPVLNIAYRIAPEHVYPAAHDDCAAAYDWICRMGPDGLPGVPTKTFISGDSAGANLAMAVCARRIQQGSRVPDAMALLCPTLDNTDNPARPMRDSDPIINAQAIAPIALYAADVPRHDPRISSLFLDDTVLANFPPLLIQASAGEFLLPDSQILSERLTALDRRHSLSIWPELPHVWHLFQALLPEAGQALEEAGLFFRNATEQ